MNVTNKYNLPSALVQAVERHEHKKANFSVTQLLKGSTEIALEMMFPDKLEMDVSDMVNMMLGTAVHKLFEEQDTLGVLNEYYMEVPSFGGFTVSGTADAVDTIAKSTRTTRPAPVGKSSTRTTMTGESRSRVISICGTR